MQHYPSRSLRRFVEESFKDVDHEFHGRVVVVENQHAIHGRLLGFRLRLCDDSRTRADNLVSLMLLRHDGFSNGRRRYEAPPATIRYENLGPLEGRICDLRSFNAIGRVWWRQHLSDRPMIIASAPKRPRRASTALSPLRALDSPSSNNSPPADSAGTMSEMPTPISRHRLPRASTASISRDAANRVRAV